MAESVSAFSNGSGGTLLLGLDERRGFKLVEGFDPSRIRDALARACANDLEPPVRAPIDIEEFEGGQVVRLDVPELDPVAKLCWLRNRGGEYRGSFIRSGDGDRLLSHFEVSQFLSNRGQPTWDEGIVPGTTLDDLDPELIDVLLVRVRRRSPRSFKDIPDVEALSRLKVVALGDNGYSPTLAGLLCLGVYPQQFFPQLFISFVALPGLTMGEELSDGTRFLDNQTCDGPIPVMVEDALDAVRRNMRVASVIRGVGRTDRYDYPLEAVRELIVNAVMHRDYSPESRGTQVQVELYPNRLVVKSPGGLYGRVDVAELGIVDTTSSRNATLAKLLADVALPSTREAVCENRGSGMPHIIGRLRDAGMSPPRFDASPAHFHVTVPQHALLDPETVEWIGRFGAGLSDAQHLALAMMRSNGSVSNEMLRAWGVDSAKATTALTDLVAHGLATKSGGRRYATYRLADVNEGEDILGELLPPIEAAVTGPELEPKLAAVVEAIRSGATTSRAIQDRLQLTYSTTIRRIRMARDVGLIEETQSRHSRAQSYRLAVERRSG